MTRDIMHRVWSKFGTHDPVTGIKQYTADDLRRAIEELEFERDNLGDFEFHILRSFKAELAEMEPSS
jgi:hypothetical protein